jgi:hypothetical protein
MAASPYSAVSLVWTQLTSLPATVVAGSLTFSVFLPEDVGDLPGCRQGRRCCRRPDTGQLPVDVTRLLQSGPEVLHTEIPGLHLGIEIEQNPLVVVLAQEYDGALEDIGRIARVGAWVLNFFQKFS